MKRLFVVSDKSVNGMFISLMKALLSGEEICFSGFKDFNKYLEDEKPDFVLINLNKPVDGGDVMGTHRYSYINSRLRVLIFNSSKIRFNLLNLVPLNLLKLKKKEKREQLV